MLCNFARFNTGTLLNFLRFSTKYPAYTPAECEKIQQAQTVKTTSKQNPKMFYQEITKTTKKHFITK